MQHYKIIENKLERFIQKFYTNLLIKGALLFLGFSLLLFIFGAALEYFLWFDSGVRTLLFWTIIAAEALLLFKLILIPISQLFKISKGIDFNEASAQIGNHFPEVSDKLKNILQLKAQGADDELVLASIEQKSKALKSVPFQLAIDFRQNVKYLRFLVIPVLVLLAIWVSGFGDSFSYSYKRIVNYNTIYEAPAPFQFSILNKNLDAKKGQSFQLNVQTLGDIEPEEVFINVGGDKLRLRESNGIYSHSFKNISKATSFQLKANQVSSKVYTLNALDVPVMKDMEMHLDYPAYINKNNTSISGTGNVSIPEGTQIEWKISTETTDQVQFFSDLDTLNFEVEDSEFSLKQIQKKNKTYSIATSNSNFKNYEVLTYNIEVIRDEYPKLNLEQKTDSLRTEYSYFFGKLTDDYGLSELQLVYYNTDNEEDKSQLNLPIPKSTYAEFSFAFPNDELKLNPDTSYSYYFKVYDNDKVNGRKHKASKVFTFRKKTVLEESSDNLKRQSKSVEQLTDALKKRKNNPEALQRLNNKQKKEKNLNYDDKQKLESFIQRQKQQLETMKTYSERLKEDFKDMDADQQDLAKDNLEERLAKNQEQIDKNQKILEELELLKDQINQEDLNKKLDAYERESNKQEKNLEQLLELTKRFYVEKKTEKLAEELQNLAKQQEDLSKSEVNTAKKQENINQDFKALKKELKELKQKNDELESPMSIRDDEELSGEIEQNQKEAQEELETSESEENDDEKQQESQEKAKKKQQKASEQLQSLAQKMKASMQSSSLKQRVEDAKMLRQILDNLIVFSIEQEGLMENFKGLSNANPTYASKLQRQAELRENFKHVDDSLYALAMRTPMIKETVNNKISDINFNVKKSLEHLSDNDVRRGTSFQQYTMMYGNELANMLDQALEQMQDSMSGSGEGKPTPNGDSPGEQLSDIIKSHEELKEAMQKKQGEGEKDNENEKGKDSEKGNRTNEGKSDGNGKGAKRSRINNYRKGEEMDGELYSIYKEQQQLRNQLEERIEQLGLKENSGELTKSLDRLEQELLMKGFSSDLLKQMEAVKHQLLKLDKAANQQGQDDKREAETRQQSLKSSTSEWKKKAKEYFRTTEILNRQQLPLQPEYKKLINQYFDGKQN